MSLKANKPTTAIIEAACDRAIAKTPHVLKFFDRSILVTVITHALRKPGKEVCGVIAKFTNRGFGFPTIGYQPFKNQATDTINAFSLPQSWKQTLERRSAIPLVIFHSHHSEDQPGQLSKPDIESARLQGLPFLLYHSDFDIFDYWDPQHWSPWPLYNPGENITGIITERFSHWPFDYGRSDCGSLLCGYYKAVFGVTLPDFPRGDSSELDDPNFTPYKDHHKERGFESLGEVTDELFQQLRAGDILVTNINKIHNHAVIVHDPINGVGLHHPGLGSTSNTVNLGVWRYRTSMVLRHKSQQEQ